MEDSVCHHEKKMMFQIKRPNQILPEKKHPKVVKGSKLTYLVDLEVAVHI